MVLCKCRVVQILSSSETCDKRGLKTMEISWPDTDYTSFLYINHSTCYFYCKERVGLNWGGLLSLAFLTHAEKFKELLKVRRTLTELRTALLDSLNT